MKVTKIQAYNFGSYEEIELDLTSNGLTLIQGATGSGKSTLCDLIPWTLFGRTAKDGAADDIKRWNASDDTKSIVTLDTNMSITRARGRSNDLYITKGEEIIRGKDIKDTQNLINQELGIILETYLAGAYYHEFSQTAQFFTAPAKTRRVICEQLADLNLAKSLQEKTSVSYKEVKNKHDLEESGVRKLESNIQMLENIQISEVSKKDKWDIQHRNQVALIKEKLIFFERDREGKLSKFNKLYKQDLEKLRTSTICSECGSTKEANPDAESHYKEHIFNLEASVNPYIELLEDKEKEINPHSGTTKDYSFEISDKTKLLNYHKKQVDILKSELTSLDILNDIVLEFRSLLVKNGIMRLQDSTNELLSNFFDAEIKVVFDADINDKIEVTILKDGNTCPYTQLSKGQRQLLKLCFSLSVMKEVSNHSGVTFKDIFLDEALDGLDNEFKLKAFNLLKSLEMNYDNIFVVEHSEALKSMFDNTIAVELSGGLSALS